MITQKRLKEALHYNQETGDFTWLASHWPIKDGSTAGSKAGNGYLMTGIDKKKYYNHRLAWLYVYGYFPETEIDHIDRNKTNNAITNLRVVSRTCNLRNSSNFANNTSGVKGVYYSKKGNHWHVQITIGDKVKYIGISKDFTEAVCMRLATEQCLGWEGCDSTSPAFVYLSTLLSDL